MNISCQRLRLDEQILWYRAFHLFVVLYCNFTSLAFLGLLGFLIRQLRV